MLTPLRLKRPIGPDSVMDRDDVLNTKRALNALGFLDAPDYGLTPYPDAPMIGAIKAFQRRHGLRVDGVMNPDGPTVSSLNEIFTARRAILPDQLTEPGSIRPIIPSSSNETLLFRRPEPAPLATVGFPPPGTSPAPRRPNEAIKTAAAGAAIPAIAGQLPGILGAIAGILGLTLPLGRDTPKEDERERRCNEQYEHDSEICRQVSAKHGSQVAQRCWASANLRYGNCLAGRPMPDLDKGSD